MHADVVDRPASWRTRYVNRLRVTDTFVVIAAVVCAHLVRFGPQTGLPIVRVPIDITYTTVSVAIVIAWMSTLSLLSSRSTRLVGYGTEEYKLVIDSSFRVFGAIAIVSLVLRIDLARGYLAVALPLGLAGLLLGRWMWRLDLVKRRMKGQCMSSVVVIGNPAGVIELAERYAKQPGDGFRVIGACVPGYTGKRGKLIHAAGASIPIFGDEHLIVEAINYFAADCIAVSATEQLGSDGIRRLIWVLEPYDVELMLTPGVADVAGPRMLLQAGTDTAMIHISKPTYNGAQKFTKSAFDVCFALFALTLTAPVLVAAAIAIKVSSSGPIFEFEETIGLRGKAFRMIRFRTAVPRRLAVVEGKSGDAEGGQSKAYVAEPTAVGEFIRSHSLDELPKFLNVLIRHMSVVGPRPPQGGEDEFGEEDVSKRLLVRPGLTGPWQIQAAAGFDLTPEQGVRLDMNYVENWSMVTDILIILKTVRVVARKAGKNPPDVPSA